MSSPSIETMASLQAPPPAKVALATILIPVLLSTALALAAVGGALFWLIRSGKFSAASAAVPTPAPTIFVAQPPSHVLALEPMIVNLSGESERSYLRATVSLRIKDEPSTAEKKDPKTEDGVAVALRDTTLTVLSHETPDGLLARDGRETLKATLLREFKLHNTEIPVVEVYFTDFLVQRG